MRKINLSNDTKRDAEVAFGTTFHRPSPVFKTADGKKILNERRVRSTIATMDATLVNLYGEGLADALVNGDPEVDMERFGLKVEGLKKVFLTPEQKVAYGVTLRAPLRNPLRVPCPHRSGRRQQRRRRA